METTPDGLGGGLTGQRSTITTLKFFFGHIIIVIIISSSLIYFFFIFEPFFKFDNVLPFFFLCFNHVTFQLSVAVADVSYKWQMLAHCSC